jgi:CRISPR-associated protein Cst2
MKAQGFLLIDVSAAALNNAGSVQVAGTDNRVITKKIVKHGQTYVYVSGQAWRYWWRDTLQKYFGWAMSPISREDKVAFTEANPVKYDDDDIFGYMRAAKEEKMGEDGKVVMKNNKPVMVDATVTRVSPLKNSALISVGAVKVATNFSSMSRHEGDPVPYGKDEYGATMKGMFSLDLEQVGTFASYNKTGFKNLNAETRKQALATDGSIEPDDKFLKDKDGNPAKLVRLCPETRKTRASQTIEALKYISGGAMQTNNMEDVTPKFIVLAITTTGNHPFTHIITGDPIRNEEIILNIEALKEVLKEYKDQFVGKVYIGRRAGFFDVHKENLDALKSLPKEEYPEIEVGAINEMIDKFSLAVKKTIDPLHKEKIEADENVQN